MSYIVLALGVLCLLGSTLNLWVTHGHLQEARRCLDRADALHRRAVEISHDLEQEGREW